MKSKASLICLILIFTNLAISGMGCSRVVVNSAENDELIASIANLQGGQRFKTIVPAIIQKCANCHTHQAWYGYNEVDYANDGLIVGGDVANSKMYFRLSTATQGPGPRNMPQGGAAAFTEEETNALADWIQNY